MIGINGGPQFPFTEAVSFMVNCKDQDEGAHQPRSERLRPRSVRTESAISAAALLMIASAALRVRSSAVGHGWL